MLRPVGSRRHQKGGPARYVRHFLCQPAHAAPSSCTLENESSLNCTIHLHGISNFSNNLLGWLFDIICRVIGWDLHILKWIIPWD